MSDDMVKFSARIEEDRRWAEKWTRPIRYKELNKTLKKAGLGQYILTDGEYKYQPDEATVL